MKKFVLGILGIVLYSFQPTIGQNLVDGGVFSSSTTDQFEVRLRPNFTTSPPTTLVTNIQFTIKWPVSSGATMLSNNSGTPFFLTPQSLTTNGGYYYQVFVTTTPFTPTWNAGEEYVCLTFTYTHATCPTFEIASDGYTAGINGTYYVELGGLNKTGILYQASSPAPTVTTPAFSLGSASSRCQAAGTVTYTALASNTTGLTYSLDAASLTGGNSIISSTGEVTYAGSWSGTSTITASAEGCSGPAIATHEVTVHPLPAAVAGIDRTICLYSSTQIGATAVGGSTYSWSSVPAGFTSSTANPIVTPLVTTTYTVVETVTASGCTNTHSVVVTVNPIPSAVAGADRSICLGASTQIGAPDVVGSTYSWTSVPAGYTSTLANPIITPSVTTIYTVVETITATGCTNNNSVVVTVNPLPAAVAGADRSICLNANTQIGAPAVVGSTYSWTSNPAGFTSTTANPTVTPLVTTTYTVIETITATGCTNTHSVIVTINPLPAAIAGADRAICLGGNTQIGATTVVGSTYSWTSVPVGFTSTSSNPTVTPAVTTTYTVVETNTATGCTNNHSVVVTVNPLPAAVAGSDRAICLNGSTQIGAAAVVGSTYSWTSVPVGFISTTANPTVTPTVATSYTVVETITATGCTNTHSVVVTLNPLPAADAGADRTICSNTSTQIGATPVAGSTYSWTSIPVGFTSTLANPTATPTVTTTYKVVETITATGCSNNHSVVVTTNPLPAAFAGANRTICSGSSTQIGTTSVVGSTYSWTSVPIGFTSTSANPIVNPTVTTTYTVVETITATGCTNTHSVIVTVTTLPAAVAGADRAICLGANTQLGASAVPGSTYSWTSVPAGFTSTSANPIVAPSVTTTYTVVETITAGGCNNSHSVIVTVNPLPAAVAGADRNICLNANTQIGATAVVGSTYSWTSVPVGFTSTSANPTVNPTVLTTYTVVETITATGCTNTNSVIVTVNPLPAAVAGSDRIICSSSNTQLGAAAVSGSTYSWTSVPVGFTSTLANPTVSPTVTTTYTLVETITATGCTNTHNVTVTVNSLPSVTWSNSLVSQCITSTSYSLTGGIPLGGTYSGAGVTGSNFNASLAGAGIKILTYTFTDGNGCTNTATNSITVNALPVVTWSNSLTQQCINSTTYTLTGGSPIGGTYSGTGVTGSNFDASIAGLGLITLTYSYNDGNGCTNSITNSIVVNSLPIAVAGIDQIIPIGTNTTLNGSVSNCSGSCQYDWQPSAMLNPPSSNYILNPNTANLSSTTIFTLVATDPVTGCISLPDEVVITTSGGGLTVSTTATPSSICPGHISQLHALASGGSGSYNYSWSSSPAGFSSTISNPVVNPTVSTTYTVTVSDGSTSQISSVLVTIYSLPVVTWTNSLTPQCINNTSYTLSGGNPSGGTYSGGGVSGTNFNASIAGIGVKVLTYTYTNPLTGCSNSTTNTVTVNALPIVTWSNPLTPQCVNSTIYSLTGGSPAGGTYSGTGVTGTNFNATVSGPGTFPLTYTYTNPITGCTNSATNPIIVDLPIVTWPNTLQLQCINSTTFTLTGGTPAGGIYSGAGVTGSNFNASIAGVGTFTLTYTYTNPLSGCSNYTTNTITVNSNPVGVTWNNALPPQCLNSGPYPLSGGLPAGGVYSGVGVAGNSFTPDLAGTGLKTLTYTYTNPATGCSSSATNTIFVNVLETIIWSNILTPQCINSTTYTLIGGSPIGGTYSGPGVVGTNFNASVAGIGTKTLTYSYTDPLTGCTNSTTNNITVNGLPSVFWTTPLTPQCASATTYTLSGGTPTGGTYSGIGVSGNNFNASVTGSGTIVLTYSYSNPVNGCVSSANNSILVNSLPIANAGTDQVIPIGTSTTLNGSATNCSGSCQFNWQPSSMLNPPTSNSLPNPATVNLSTSTTYTVIVNNPLTGCQSLPDAVVISVSGGGLSVLTTATPLQVCLGQSSQLLATASGGTGVYNYSWSSVPSGFSSTIFNPIVTPSVSTTYTVTVTSGAYSQTGSVTVEIKSLPTVTWGTSLPAICVNSTTYSLSGGTPAGGTYGGPGVSGNNFNASLAGIGTKTLTYTYTNGNGCSNSATNTIIVNSLPEVTWNNSLSSQCLTSTTYALTGGLPVGGTYSGSGVSGTNFNASLAGAGTKILTYTYTDLLGCTNSITNSITVNSLPTITWSNALQPQCINSTSYTLTGGNPAGGTYSGAGVTGTNFNASVAGTGLKVLTYTYSNPTTGCTNSGTNTITVNSLPSVMWSNSLSVQCINSTTFTLTGGFPTGGTYSGPGVSGNIFNASLAGAGTISLTYSYTNPSTGCTNSATNSIVVNSLPTVTWTNMLTSQCINSTSYTLTGATPSGGTYSGAGVSGTNFNASLAGVGTKTITYTFLNPSTGCTNSVTNSIIVFALPTVSWSNSLQPQCATSTTYLLTGGTPVGGTYSGLGVSGTNFNASIAGQGVKTLTYTYSDPITGCTNSTTNTILVNATPTVIWINSLPGQCINSTAYTLTGGTPSGGTYSGPGVSGTNFNASLAGIGLITLTYNYTNPVTGCSNFATNTIMVNALPVVTWSNTLSVQCLVSSTYTLTGGSPSGGTYSGPGVTGSNFNASVAGLGTHTLVYTYVNSNGCLNTALNTITVKTTPPGAGNISGASIVCPGTSNALYSIAALPNVTSYSWWIIGGASIVSGQGTNQIAVNFTGVTGTVYINVMGLNECGSGQIAPVKQVTINPVLYADAGPADSLIYGFGTTLQGLASGGLPPYTYSWTPTTGLSNPNIANPVATPLTTTVYKLVVHDAANCSAIDSTRIAVSPPFGSSVSGHVTYNGNTSLPLNNVHLYLKQNDTVKYTCVSNINGEYNFAGVLPGIYHMSGSKQLVFDPNYWGGINAIDALIISCHFVGTIHLTGVRLIAADVDNSHYINSTDAFITLKKFVRLIDSFPAGDWVFDTCTITVMGDVVKNIEGLNVGDVNASNTNPLKTETSNILLKEQDYLEVPSTGIFELPVILNEDLNIGATSVVLNYPNEIFKFYGVEMFSGNERLAYSEKDGVIRIGWYSTNGTNLKKGTVLFTLKLQLRNTDVQIPDGISFSVTTESVISDPQAYEYSPVTLLIPHLIKHSVTNSEFVLFGNTPNPFSHSTKITYQLPSDGNISVRIYNASGELIEQLLNKEFKTSGNYSLDYNNSQLTPGTYWYVFDFANEKTFITKSRKMIITR